MTLGRGFDWIKAADHEYIGFFGGASFDFKTNADDVTIEVVPGIGIVRYRYCHHGTPEELDLKLIETGNE